MAGSRLLPVRAGRFREHGMIVSRAAERRRLDDLLAALIRGEGGALPGSVSFVHPLICGMVYRDARAADRRAAHAALTAALRDDDDRRVWHVAAAAIGPEEEVAAGLERVGGRAVARRAYAAGSGALERAARLTPDPDAASRRLIMAGQAAAGAGLADRALALFAEAAEVTGAAEQRAHAQHLRGRMLVWRGRGAGATPLLVGQVRRVAPRWPRAWSCASTRKMRALWPR